MTSAQGSSPSFRADVQAVLLDLNFFQPAREKIQGLIPPNRYLKNSRGHIAVGTPPGFREGEPEMNAGTWTAAYLLLTTVAGSSPGGVPDDVFPVPKNRFEIPIKVDP